MTDALDALHDAIEASAYPYAEPILAALRERGFDVVPIRPERDLWIEQFALGIMLDVVEILDADRNDARRKARAQIAIRAALKIALA